MNKYDPDESITCPKCGRKYVAEVMSVRWFERYEGEETVMVLRSLCGFYLCRRPLDYEGDD